MKAGVTHACALHVLDQVQCSACVSLADYCPRLAVSAQSNSCSQKSSLATRKIHANGLTTSPFRFQGQRLLFLGHCSRPDACWGDKHSGTVHIAGGRGHAGCRCVAWRVWAAVVVRRVDVRRCARFQDERRRARGVALVHIAQLWHTQRKSGAL